MQKGLLQRRIRRIGYSAFVLALGTMAYAETPETSSTQRTELSRPDGATISPGRFLATHLAGPWLQRLEALSTAPLNLPRRPNVSRAYGPLRQITFLGGDRISGEIVRWQNDSLEFRLSWGMTVPIRRDAISMIHVPSGESEQFFEGFESDTASTTRTDPKAKTEEPAVKASAVDTSLLDSTRSVSGQRSLRLTNGSNPYLLEIPDLPNVRVQFWFRVDPLTESRDPTDSSARVDFEFQSSAPATWKLELTHSTAAFVQALVGGKDSDRRAIKISPGWHCLTLVADADRSMCLVDESVLHFDSRRPGSLRAIRFSSTASAWFDSLLLSSLHDGIKPPRAVSQDDVVSVGGGIQFYGQLNQVNPDAVVLMEGRRNHEFRWGQIQSITFRQADRQIHDRGSVPIGRIATIDFQSLADRPRMPTDRITVSILEVKREFLVVAHPWLGKIAVSWTQIARIQADFFGQLVQLDARQIHLGDSIRPDFNRQTPDGTEWSGEFELPVSITKSPTLTRVAIEVTEVEPSGPETPPASPFVDELRRGQLITQLQINNESAGELNRFLKFRSKPDQPETLRIPLKPGLLHPGHNVFRLKQIPQLKSGRYDNCELSNLRLEIVMP